jgi:predicted phosphodiesterase
VRDAREHGGGQLSHASIEWLDALPPERRARWDGTRVVAAHGMPGGIDTYVFPGQIPKRLKRVVRTLGADVLLLDHTHNPMSVQLGDLLIDDPRAVVQGHDELA